MKVGTDGVLLGAWASLGAASGVGAAAATASPGPLRPDADSALPPLHLLDIGTGTGLVALMLAQRAASRAWGWRAFSVTAVEREAAAASQARENVSASPWASLVTVVTADIRTWRPAAGESATPATDLPADVQAAAGNAAPHFDLIACNPPFFTESLKCPDAARNAARHDDTLPIDDLFRLAAAWLKPAPAAFNLILPAGRERSAVDAAARHGLRLSRLCRVFTAPTATGPSRVLLAFVRDNGQPVGSPPIGSPLVENLCIQATPPYGEAFRALVHPFYLNV